MPGEDDDGGDHGGSPSTLSADAQDFVPGLVPGFMWYSDRMSDEQDQVDRRNGKRGWWTKSDNAAWEQYEEARLRARGPNHLYKRYRLNKWGLGLVEVAVKHVRFLDDVVELGGADGGGTDSDDSTGSGGGDCGGNGMSASGSGGGGGGSGNGGGGDGGSSDGDCSDGGGGTDGSHERQWRFGADVGDGAMAVAGTFVPGAAMADASNAGGNGSGVSGAAMWVTAPGSLLMRVRRVVAARSVTVVWMTVAAMRSHAHAHAYRGFSRLSSVGVRKPSTRQRLVARTSALMNKHDANAVRIVNAAQVVSSSGM